MVSSPAIALQKFKVERSEMRQCSALKTNSMNANIHFIISCHLPVNIYSCGNPKFTLLCIELNSHCAPSETHGQP